MPAAACTMPSLFGDDQRAPATGEHPLGLGVRPARGAARRGPPGRGRGHEPALDLRDTPCDVTTTTSPSAIQGAAAATAAPRSSPGRNSGSPRTGSTEMPSGAAWSGTCSGNCGSRQLERAPRHLGGGVDVGHQQRHGLHLHTRRRRPRRRVCTSQPSSTPAVGARAVGRATASAVVSTPIAVRHASAIPRSGRPPTIGDSPTTLARVSRRASRTPGTSSRVPMLTTGLDGASSTASASRIASRAAGRTRRLVGADRDEAVRRQLGLVAHPPLLEVDRLARLLAGGRVVDDRRGSRRGRRWPGSSVTPGRQRVAQRRDHVGEPVAGAQHPLVRTRWVAMSRSPRPNQVGSAP